MKIINIINRFRTNTAPAADAPHQRGQVSQFASPAQTSEVAEIDDLDGAVQEFQSIQQMLKMSSETVEIPAKALLASLPAELRGDAWKATEIPEGILLVDKAELLEQLEKGRAVFPLRMFLDSLPKGWVRNGVDAMVELSLADVVSAIPPEMLQAATKMSEAAEQVAGMRDYFMPKSPAKPTAPRQPVAAETEEADAMVVPLPATLVNPMQPARKKQQPALPEWNGVEDSLDAAPRGVDVNTASLEALENLPGVGPVRARAIIQERSRRGRFASIFDLTEVPGIGPVSFRQITGLNARNRFRRQAKLARLIGLEVEGQIPVADILQKTVESVAATGGVLTSHEGICFASVGVMKADLYAAVVAKLMSRSKRYLSRLDDTDVNCIVLPAGKTPLLIASGSEAALIFTLKTTSVSKRTVNRIVAIMREIDWLMSRRAIIRAY